MPAFDPDELARRRPQTGDNPYGNPDESQEKPPHFSWSDILAMIIAAYQIILPILFLFIGVIVAAYLLFRFIFT